MSSLITAFILAHWEDILIGLGVSAIFLFIDLFVVHRGHSENEALDATDRLFSYFLLAGVFVFVMIWLSDEAFKDKGLILMMFGIAYFTTFVIFIAHRHSLLEQKHKVPKKIVSNRKGPSRK
jgi:hypothetical protein